MQYSNAISIKNNTTRKLNEYTPVAVVTIFTFLLLIIYDIIKECKCGKFIIVI